MKLNHKFYNFCPRLLVPNKWGRALKNACEAENIDVEIPPQFYLHVLGSISLNIHDKIRVLLQVNDLTREQISDLEDVFTGELISFEENIFSIERDEVIKVLCENLLYATTTLRFFGIIKTPREEIKILKKIAFQWLENNEPDLQSLQKYQHSTPAVKQILRCYKQ